MLLHVHVDQQARLILVSFASDHEYLTASVHFSIVLLFHVHHVILTVLSHSVPQRGWTALMEASVSGHTDVVQLLLSSGAQVDLQDWVRHNLNYSRTLVKGTRIGHS